MKTWKWIGVMGLAALIVGCGGGGGDNLDACDTCAATDAGVVKGVREGEVLAFKSIPYAAAPTGKLRFRPPQPAVTWTGVRDASQFKEVCPQIKDALEFYPYAATKVFNELTGADTEIFENEDCLHVSVWSPALDQKKRPVMLFIPGGAFQVGDGSSEYYSGQHLAAQDVVVMTINYRLGILGFLELGQLDPSYAGSGNNGLRDQIAALQWAHRNAAAFGGDPDNITVFGESAGSISLSALLATKSPEKLFKRAIGQSGGPNLLHTSGFQQIVATVITDGGPKKTIADLNGASVRELLKQQQNAIQNSGVGDALFAPFFDNDLLIGNPYDVIANGNAKGIDLMVGANQDELGYWSLYDSQLRNPYVQTTDSGTPSPLISSAKRAFLDSALAPSSLDAVYTDWIAANGATMGGRTLGQTVELTQDHDFIMILPMTRLAEKQAANNPNTYLYRFQWKVPRSFLSSDSEDVGAIHSLELPFVFGTLNLDWVPGGRKLLMTQSQRDQAQALANSMMSAWTNFARNGNPNGADVPTWNVYNTTTRPTMLWKNDTTGQISSISVNDPDATRRTAWKAWDFPLIFWPLP